MNRVETWFGILTPRSVRRGSVGSVNELIAKIELFAASWKAGASPVAWAKTADEILAKAVRKRPATSESRHEETPSSRSGGSPAKPSRS